MEHDNLAIVLVLTIGLGLAGLFAYLARLIKLPSILGYLLAGFIIGPHSPGFVADPQISEQLAELGVIMMLFGVGLHFKVQDLINVKSIAIPGAATQTLCAAIVTMFIVYYLGGTLSAGLIMGLAVGVASTVVLVRVLTDNHLLNTKEGHIAIGWLVVEDIFTVIILILLPTFATFLKGVELSLPSVAMIIGMVFIKMLILALFMFTWGHKIVNYILIKTAQLRSQELFSLTLLALLFVITVGSTYLFDTSIALGAFIAGMVIGKTSVRHQAAANALPLKDIFAVVFFLSVGMLFNPMAIWNYWPLFLGILLVVIFIKPLAAFLITAGLGYSVKIALTVAIALAQIGEFSFILAEEAVNLNIVPHEGLDILVAVALLTISINPILFQGLGYIESLLNKFKSVKRPKDFVIGKESPFPSKNILIVGFGPIGRHLENLVKRYGYSSVVIENNIDTVSDLEEISEIIYGDATDSTILIEAGIDKARFLLITIPDSETTFGIIETARQINPKIKIVARTKYISEKSAEDNVTFIAAEEESMKKFSSIVSKLLS